MCPKIEHNFFFFVNSKANQVERYNQNSWIQSIICYYTLSFITQSEQENPRIFKSYTLPYCRRQNTVVA